MFMVAINKPRKLSVTKVLVPTIAGVTELIQEELIEMHDDIWSITVEPTDIKYWEKL